MKITINRLKTIISEETQKFLLEMKENEEFLQIFVDLHRSLTEKRKSVDKRLKIVNDVPPFDEILDQVKQEKGLDVSDLLGKLEEMEGDIDQNMFLTLRDEFTKKIYDEDSEFLSREESDEEFDDKMSKMYQSATGRPDLRVVK